MESLTVKSNNITIEESEAKLRTLKAATEQDEERIMYFSTLIQICQEENRRLLNIMI